MAHDEPAEEAEIPDGPPELTLGGALGRGVETIRDFVRTLPAGPGVYRMLNAKGDALYVGKARNLKNRVANYMHVAALSNRLRRMVAETHALEVVVTHTEVEALLLECNLIKRLMPRYNVLLRDDKSFPYIHLTGGSDFPQLTKHRGARGETGDYFGPFANAGAVNRTLIALQRAFLLRSCNDSVFQSRTRPCLLYQIKRCSGPCVGRIDRDGYSRLLNEAREFLAGHSKEVQEQLARRMQDLSERLEFESAALLRDRIRALTQVQGRQDINVESLGDADIVAAHQAGGQTSIQVFFFRGGQNWGNRAYFPSHDRQLALPDVLAAFIGQFYDNKPIPPLILTSDVPTDRDLLVAALSAHAGRKIELATPQRGDKRKLVEHALVNAREALARKLAESSTQQKLLAGVAEAFGLDAPPQRIEVYDNSHIQGSHPVGAMIVAGPEGLMKNAYRKFNIRGVARQAAAPAPEGEETRTGTLETAIAEATDQGSGAPAGGDDYAMMREVLGRRFARALKEDPERERGTWPDLILIDGGAGQLSSAQRVMVDLGIDDLPVVGIAKGPDRDAGRERFFRPGRPPSTLDPKDPVLYFLQRLRDEAHRFAIGTHRARRTKAIGASPLDEIPGIGARRKRALLHHFGSARGVARAGLADLERVAGISGTIAKKVYDHFHAEG
ncbi:MAG TPA: excinuclease ABC subunit UvrC [Stellaceae bacterium]|nr:excinuclease ABC subunit UvrC [Stellaceae bacterium]